MFVWYQFLRYRVKIMVALSIGMIKITYTEYRDVNFNKMGMTLSQF